MSHLDRIRELTEALDDDLALSDDLRRILDSIPALIFFKSKTGIILRCNSAFALAAGVSAPSAIEGTHGADWWPGEYVAKHQFDDQEVITSGKPKRNIYEPLVAPNGTTRWVRTDKIPLYRDNEVVGILGFSIDITDSITATGVGLDEFAKRVNWSKE